MKTIFAQNNGYGDILWVEPIVRHFLAEGEEVFLNTTAPSLFDNYPSDLLYVNRLEKLFPLSDYPIELRFQDHPKMHHLEAYCLAAGISNMELSYPKLYLSPEEKKRKIEKEYALFHLDRYENARNFRNVYGVDWEEVVRYVRSQGLEPIQISKEGADLVTTWHPTQDFREVISLISHAKLFIGLDSGPSHVAAAMRIPSVLFFGSVNPMYRHLDRIKKVFLQSPCPFAHCYHGKPGTFGEPCRRVEQGQAPPCCIQDTSRVIDAIRQIL